MHHSHSAIMKYENYIVKENNNVVGSASILDTAREIVEANDIMLVPLQLQPMEDVEEVVVARSNAIRPSRGNMEETIKEVVVARRNTVRPSRGDMEEAANMEDLESSSCEEENAEDEIIEEDVNGSQEKEGSNQTRNSPMMFAIPIADPNAKGKKTKAKCLLCNKVLLRKSFPKHIYDVHTSDAKEKCEICDKEMSKKSLSLHMRSVHFKEKVNCNECGIELALSSLKSHKHWHKNMENK